VQKKKKEASVILGIFCRDGQGGAGGMGISRDPHGELRLHAGRGTDRGQGKCRHRTERKQRAGRRQAEVKVTSALNYIDTVFAKTSPKRSFSMTEYERYGLVFTKTRVYQFGQRRIKNEESGDWHVTSGFVAQGFSVGVFRPNE
jgi:hypothetical protein